MQTECMSETLAFQGVAGREVIARFDGGTHAELRPRG